MAIRLAAALALAVSLAPRADAAASGLDLDLLDSVLAGHTHDVSDTAQTRVDYRALRTSADWKRLVASLRAADSAKLETGTERKAFWVNAYNILAIDLVVKNPGLDSIKDIGSFFFPVWKREAGYVGDRPYTLDHIEHEILRPMGDARLHVAIICASVSCPPLRREAWRADRLDDQLSHSLGAWLANPRKGLRVDRAAGTVHLSKIFDWFEDDFRGGVIAFVRRYAGESDATWLEQHPDPSISYLPYDWSLNALPGRS